jgi:Na+-driven multidrug efflux pump
MAKRLLLAALCIGCFSAVFSRIVPVYFPYSFTTDSTVAALMKEISPVSSLALLLHTSSMASEGCLLAGRDTKFMSMAYVPNALLAWIGLGFTLKAGFGIQAAWFALAQFHFVRLSVNSWRLLSRQSPLRKQLKED